MGEDSRVDFEVNESAAKMAIRREEIDAEELYDVFEQLREVYHFAKREDRIIKSSEVSKILRYQGIEKTISDPLVILRNLGLLEEEQNGYVVSEGE